MPPSLVPVLPYVLEHLEPSLPHAFTVLVKSDYLHISEAYRSLAACSLVCHSWRWDAQIALFRTAILSRPSRTTRDHLDVFDGGITNGAAFLRALSSRPTLGDAVLYLSLSCDEESSGTAREILELCSSVIVLVLRTHPEMDLAYYLCVFAVLPSVRTFSHKGSGDEINALPSLQWTFPCLKELQAVNLEPMRCPPPIVELPHLHYLDISESDETGMAELAKSCPDLALDYLRIEILDSLQASVRPFGHTLCVLDIASFAPTSWYTLRPDDMDCVAEMPELRVLSIRRSPAGLYLSGLPPNLEMLVININALNFQSARMRRAFKTHALLSVVTIHYNDDSYVAAIDRFFDDIPADHALVWDDCGTD